MAKFPTTETLTLQRPNAPFTIDGIIAFQEEVDEWYLKLTDEAFSMKAQERINLHEAGVDYNRTHAWAFAELARLEKDKDKAIKHEKEAELLLIEAQMLQSELYLINANSAKRKK